MNDINDVTKNSWLFIAEKMTNLSELDDLLIDESKDIHLAVLNLKVISAHLKSSGLASGIDPVCDLIDRISKNLKQHSVVLKNQRVKAQTAIKMLDNHFEVDEETVKERAEIKIMDK